MRGLCAALLLLVAAPVAGAQTDEAEPIAGAGSFNAAPELQPGVYSDTVLPGEGTFYRVELAKGQTLAVEARFDLSGFELIPGQPGFVPGLNAILYDVQLYTPLRQPIAGDQQDASGDIAGQTVSVQSQEALGYEDILSGDYTDSDFNGPGTYYIALFTDELLGDAPNLEIPAQLRVDVSGAPEPSSRDYHPRLIPVADSEEPSADGGGDEDSETSAAAVAGLGAAALALGAAAGALGGRWRRS